MTTATRHTSERSFSTLWRGVGALIALAVREFVTIVSWRWPVNAAATRAVVVPPDSASACRSCGMSAATC